MSNIEGRISIAKRKLNSEVCELRENSSRGIVLKEGKVGDYTKALRWLAVTKNRTSFIIDLRSKLKRNGSKSFSLKQRQALMNCYYNFKGDIYRDQNEKEKSIIKSAIKRKEIV